MLPFYEILNTPMGKPINLWNPKYATESHSPIAGVCAEESRSLPPWKQLRVSRTVTPQNSSPAMIVEKLGYSRRQIVWEPLTWPIRPSLSTPSHVK